MTNWEPLAIPFQGGIDTKSDAKTASPAKFVELENGVFTKRGSVRKRHGYDRTENQDSSESEISADIVTTLDESLILLGKNASYTYSAADDNWLKQGYFNRVAVATDEVESSTASRTMGDQAEVNGVGARAWINQAGGMEIAIYDVATGARIKGFKGGTIGSGNRPRCLAVGAFLHVVFAVGSSTDLMTLPINTFSPANTVEGDAAIIASDLHADEIFDAVTSSTGNDAVFAWYSTSSDELRWGRLLPTGATESKGGTSSGAIVAMSIGVNSEYLVIGHVEATGLVMTSVSDVNGGMANVADTGSESESGFDRVSIAVAEGKFCCLFENQTAEARNQDLVRWSGDPAEPSANEIGTAVIQHSHLLSAGFSVGGSLYVFVGHESARQLQNSVFLLELSPEDDSGSAARVVAHVHYGAAAPRSSEPHLPRFSASAEALVGILPYRRPVESDDGEAVGYLGLSRVAVEANSVAYEAAQAGRALYCPGGILWHLDGYEPVESGFLLAPELDVDPTSTDAADHGDVSEGGAGAIAAGTYGYKVYYEWPNAHGEVMRSLAIGFSVAATGSKKMVLTIPTLYHTHKGVDASGGARDEVSIAVYRTSAGGTKHHRISSTDPTATGDNGYLLNDRTSSSVTFTDNLADASANELDPLLGLINNVAPTACSVATMANRRLWMAGGDIPDNNLYYSKLRIDGQPIECNNNTFVEIPDRGGQVVGVRELSDATVVFKRSQIYFVAGEGPNNSGFGEFREAVQVSTDVGCVDPRSIVETPDGLMFNSAKGVYLLTKSFSVEYVGAEVEAYNSESIVSAELVPDQNLAIFLASEGRTLAYDYLFRQWSTFTGHLGISATLWKNKYCYLDSAGAVYRQNPERYKDGNVAYKFRGKTGPIRGEGLQQLWRCKRIYLLGEYFSEHSLRMNVWFNREAAPRESVTFEPEDFIDDSRWGDDPTWGDSEVWGGQLDGRDYQVSYGLESQKAQSISLEFEEIPGAEPGRSFELTELAMLWARMPGLGRLADARRR